jgi:tRNA uridine 5-carboxymethylaminomethyl modification enzyme
MEIGCVSRAREQLFRKTQDDVSLLSKLLLDKTLSPSDARKFGLPINLDGVVRSAFSILSYPNVAFGDLVGVWPDLRNFDQKVIERVEVDAKYSVYLEKQAVMAEDLRRDEQIQLFLDTDYDTVPGLSNEVRAKLKSARPSSLGQASRIEGVTPAALTILLALTKRRLQHVKGVP